MRTQTHVLSLIELVFSYFEWKRIKFKYNNTSLLNRLSANAIVNISSIADGESKATLGKRAETWLV